MKNSPETKEVIPDENYSANSLPLNNRLESIETAPDLTENGEVVHPLLNGSTGEIPSDKISKPPVPQGRKSKGGSIFSLQSNYDLHNYFGSRNQEGLAEEDTSTRNLSSDEKGADPEENGVEAGTGPGVAKEVTSKKETGDPVNEAEGGKSQPISHLDKGG
jgi:hypothetical protein